MDNIWSDSSNLKYISTQRGELLTKTQNKQKVQKSAGVSLPHSHSDHILEVSRNSKFSILALTFGEESDAGTSLSSQ